jgi:hypothetical protein
MGVYATTGVEIDMFSEIRGSRRRKNKTSL